MGLLRSVKWSSTLDESQNYLHPVASPASRITSANFLPAPCSKSPWKIQIFVLTSMRILHECETTDPTGLHVENEVETHMSYTLPTRFSIHCVSCTKRLHTDLRCVSQKVTHPYPTYLPCTSLIQSFIQRFLSGCCFHLNLEWYM